MGDTERQNICIPATGVLGLLWFRGLYGKVEQMYKESKLAHAVLVTPPSMPLDLAHCFADRRTLFAKLSSSAYIAYID